MRNVLKELGYYALIKEKIKRIYQDNNSVLGDSALSNVLRIYYLSMIAIPLRIVILFTFNAAEDTQALRIWSQGIRVSHTILLVLMIGFFLISLRLKNRKEATTTMYIMQYIVVGVIMAIGIAIVTFDQLITTNITPFILTCIIIGTVILIRPLISFILYASSYMAYYHLLGLTITNQEILISNRLNGITAVGVGFLLSIILWHYNYINISQKKHIELQQKQLEQMAYYDPLTDLPNRRLFEKLVKQEFSSINRYGHESVLIILDIDGFKNINDTYGHPGGDKILRQLACILRDNIRESDTVSRFGGEEFVILMPKTSLDGGYAFAERLRILIMERIFIVESRETQITCSFGLSLLNDAKSERFEDYYALADEALYQAKQQGKNRVEVTICDELKGNK